MSDESKTLAVAEVQHEVAPMTLFGVTDPERVVEMASRHAKALAAVVEQQHLYTKIGPSRHVHVEAWTLLGSMTRVYAIPTWTRPILESERIVGYEARVEARTIEGVLVGAAESECRFSERNSRGLEHNQVRSKAQTRAVSKALRLPLGFILVLAGYNPTPAEEMIEEEEQKRGRVAPAKSGPVAHREGPGSTIPPSETQDTAPPPGPALVPPTEARHASSNLGVLTDEQIAANVQARWALLADFAGITDSATVLEALDDYVRTSERLEAQGFEFLSRQERLRLLNTLVYTKEDDSERGAWHREITGFLQMVAAGGVVEEAASDENESTSEGDLP